MKLMFCKKCRDVVSLCYKKRNCACKECGGKYRDDGRTVDVSGPYLLIGITNNSLMHGMGIRELFGTSEQLDAWIMGDEDEKRSKTGDRLDRLED